MSFETLSERMKQYERCSDYSLIQRIPIIVRIDGKGFSSLTKNLSKPFCPIFQRIMFETMLDCASKIQGLVIAYQQSDEITFILRNDQSLEAEPWYSNRTNKIISITAATATLIFNKILQKVPTLDLVGDAIFDAHISQVPDLTEACNNLIWRQQDCMRNAITSVSQHHLGLKFGKKTALKILNKKISVEKIQLLSEQCGIDFEEHYPSSFKRGVAVYKVPTLLSDKENTILRDKWTLNLELPIFTEEKDLIPSILINRRDILRGDSVLKNDDKTR
jgi:tRNA(His) guanylyltransferase